MPQPPSRRARATLGRVLTITCTAAAWLPAQRQTQPPPGGVHLRGLTGELGLTAEWRDESSSSTNGNQLQQRERLLREIIGVHALGDVYHPALLDFDLGVELSFDQRDTDSGSQGTNQWSNSVNSYYDGRVAILKEKSISGDLYARRGRLDTQQRFFATSIADTSAFGGNVRFKEIWIPSVLHYEKNSYTGHGLDQLRQNNEQWSLEGSRNGEETTASYTLQRNNINQESFRTHYDESVARADLGQRFGGDMAHIARVGGYFRDQTGDLNSRYLQGNANLHLQWLEDLYSEHTAMVDRSEIDTLTASTTQDTLDLSSSLHHQLYDSLSTGLGGRHYRSKSGQGHSERNQGDLDVNYRKQTSFGSLGINYQPSLYQQDEVGSTSPVPVLDEALTYTVGVPLLLRFTGAIASTVVVTDATGTVLYVEPSDYVISPTGAFLELLIPIGSRIADGNTLLVDYVYDPSPDRSYRGLSQNVGVAFEFGDYAALNLEHFNDRLELIEGLDDGTLGNTRRNVVRGRVYHWEQELSADYEDFENRNNPYERVQVQALSRLALSDDMRWSNTGRWYRTRFKQLGGEDRGITLSSTLDWRVGRPTLLYVRGEYHDVTYRADSGQGWMVESGLDFRTRNNTLTLEARYTSERFEIASDQDLLYIQFVFRRIF